IDTGLRLVEPHSRLLHRTTERVRRLLAADRPTEISFRPTKVPASLTNRLTCRPQILRQPWRRSDLGPAGRSVQSIDRSVVLVGQTLNRGGTLVQPRRIVLDQTLHRLVEPTTQLVHCPPSLRQPLTRSADLL